jgi:hypothetical protein
MLDRGIGDATGKSRQIIDSVRQFIPELRVTEPVII